MYRDVSAAFVLDSRDRELAGELDALGFRTLVLDTVMADGGVRLAAEILDAFR
jgi:hypothetical protein